VPALSAQATGRIRRFSGYREWTTPEFVVDSVRTIDLRGTTDHPGLLVTLARRAARRTS